MPTIIWNLKIGVLWNLAWSWFLVLLLLHKEGEKLRVLIDEKAKKITAKVAPRRRRVEAFLL